MRWKIYYLVIFLISSNLKGRMPAKQRAPADVVASEPTRTTRATVRQKSRLSPQTSSGKVKKTTRQGCLRPRNTFLTKWFSVRPRAVNNSVLPRASLLSTWILSLHDSLVCTQFGQIILAHNFSLLRVICGANRPMHETKLITFRSCVHQNKNNDETKMEAHGLHSYNNFTLFPSTATGSPGTSLRIPWVWSVNFTFLWYAT